MKKLTVLFIATMTVFTFSAKALETTQVFTTAGGDAQIIEDSLVKKGGIRTASTPPEIRLALLIGPSRYDPNFQSWAKMVAEAHYNGEVPEGTEVAHIQVLPEDVMTAPVGIPFHRGVFNPTAPNSTSQGSTIWVFLYAKAVEGETISLSQVSGQMKSGAFGSSNPENALGKTIGFGSNTYSEAAFGVTGNGTRVTSGSSSQEVESLIVGIGFPSFSVTSEADVQEVRDYIESNSNWTISCRIGVGGISATRTLVNKIPRVKTTQMTDSVSVTLEDTQIPATLQFETAEDVTGPWSLTNETTFSFAGDRKFMRLGQINSWPW